MLSVSVHKDVGEYKPKIIGKLTGRSLACIALALAVAVLVGAYCWFVLAIPTTWSQYLIFLATLPIWAAGFWRPRGLLLEHFLPLWAAHAFTDGRIYFVSTPTRLGLARVPDQALTKAYARLRRKPSIEAYEPLLAYEEAGEIAHDHE